jgi:MFS family permease
MAFQQRIGLSASSIIVSAFEESSLRYQGWRVAGASAVGLFFASILIYGFAVLLKPLAEEFGWQRGVASTAYAALTAAAALAAPVCGLLLDRYGPLRVVVPCLAFCGLGIASLSALTASPVHAYALFTALGLAVIGTSPLAYSRAVSTWFDRRRGLALGIVIGGGAAASITHPPAIDALINLVGWRRACVLLGALVLGVGLPTVIGFVRERAASLAASHPEVGGAKVPEALRSWIFWILIVVVAGAAIAFNAVVVHLVALLTDRGVSSGRAAMALSAMGGAGLVGRLLTGWLMDHLRATWVSAGLLAIAALGLFLLADASTLAVALLAAALIGFGMGGELDVSPFLLSRYFGLRSMSTLYGFVWTTSGVGAAIGSIVMGRAYDATGSYEGMLLRLSATTVFVALLMLTLPGYGLLIPEQCVSADLTRSEQPPSPLRS